MDIRKTLCNVSRYYRVHGLASTLKRVDLEIRRRVVRPFIGKMIELSGNRWKLDNCVFLLDSPLIPLYRKAQFFTKVYENEMRSLIRKHLLRDRPTIELGGAIGVVACTTNRLLEHRSQHLVVEANPELIPLLSANKKANEAQFEIVEAAIAYGMDVVTFFQHPKNLLGGNVHRPTNRMVTVKTTTLADLLAMTGYEDITHVVS